MKKILISVCTYLRPNMLERALNCIIELKMPEDILVEILIVDNDKNLSAKNIVEKFKDISPYKILQAKTDEATVFHSEASSDR